MKIAKPLQGFYRWVKTWVKSESVSENVGEILAFLIAFNNVHHTITVGITKYCRILTWLF